LARTYQNDLRVESSKCFGFLQATCWRKRRPGKLFGVDVCWDEEYQNQLLFFFICKVRSLLIDRSDNWWQGAAPRRDLNLSRIVDETRVEVWSSERLGQWDSRAEVCSQ
jgi:hypothetical protein